MARYKVVERSYIDKRIVDPAKPGEPDVIVELVFPPGANIGSNLELVDKPAEASKPDPIAKLADELV